MEQMKMIKETQTLSVLVVTATKMNFYQCLNKRSCFWFVIQDYKKVVHNTVKETLYARGDL